MSIIHLILNLAGLLLWMDWRSGRGQAQPQAVISLANSVRPAERARGKGWGSLAALGVLLLARPVVYSSLGRALDWTPKLEILAISIPWRSDLPERMFLYSTLSFLLALGWYCAALLLLSAAEEPAAQPGVMQRFVRLQLGKLALLPWWLKLLAPPLAAGLGWAVLAPVLVGMGLLTESARPEQMWGQALASGLAAVLAWKWVLAGLFGLHLLNTYVFLGAHPVWQWITGLAGRLLWPLSFLRFGRMDLSALAGIALVIAAADFLVRPGVARLFQHFLE